MINSLTSIRFLFAFMVFLSHLSFLRTEENTFSSWLFDNIFKEGALGVSFFFVLSGFILSYRYQNRFTNGLQSRSFFYIGRISRIYPLHIFTFIISLPFVFRTYEGKILNLLAKGFFNLSLTQSFIPKKSVYFSFNMPSWSLSDEMFFYFLFPLLSLRIKPNNLKLNTYIAVSLTILILILLTLVPSNLHHQFFYINPIIRLYDFVMGIFLFGFYNRLKQTKLKFGTLFELLSIISFCILFALHNNTPTLVVNSIYYMVPICLIILSTSLEQGKVSQLLQCKLFVILGEISFAFYMIHQLVIRYYLIAFPMPLLNHFLDVLLLLFVSIILSYLTYKHIELKSKNLIRKYYSKQKTEPCN
ncbi:acyltransferase family protein [Saccharicrinis sp. 156]|uniref:acyltransferase family protein n=1 Tax=Saccharicrinis sp. 156 TaxID=3417574 RepID=UPI003D33DB88